MNKIKTTYNKIEKKHIGLIFLAQSVVMIFLIVYVVYGSNTEKTTASAQASTFSEEITNDARVCLSLSPEERPVCAKMAGVKIAGQTTDARQRLAECLKFRPYYVHDCQLGLSAGQ